MVDVQKPFFEGGPGAWQAGIRYDRIDLNDGNVLGGRQKGWTFVLNWYLSNRFWLATNYSRTELEYDAATVDTTDGVAVRLHYQIRW